jgi:glycosyltransferase involved in cell wall biosynthesis
MTSPTVSVVVPLYNKRATIRRSLDSVLGQTFRDFEVIVVDDGSTDGGAEIAEGTGDPRVHVIRQPNRGVSAARNRGIAEATAALVAFLDADDLWAPEFLTAIVELEQTFPGAGMYLSGRRQVNPDGSAIDIWAALPEGRSAGILPSYFAAPAEGGLAHSSCVAVPRSVLAAVGGFREGEHMGEDIDMWVRIAARYPVACQTRVLATYYDGGPERDLARARQRPPSFPALMSLRSLVAAGGLSARTNAAIKRYVDYKAIEHLCFQLELGLTPFEEVARKERCYHWRFGLEAAMIRAGLRILPPRAVWRLWSLPMRGWRKVQRLRSQRGDVIQGRVIVRRIVPAPAQPAR